MRLDWKPDYNILYKKRIAEEDIKTHQPNELPSLLAIIFITRHHPKEKKNTKDPDSAS